MEIPKEIKNILSDLQKSGYQAYIVGGCVRDGILGLEPKDWDITTDASPEQIQKVFPKNFYTNNFGTVTAMTGSDSPTLANVEITPFRTESMYSDNRHPDQVQWAKTIEEDLSRRDFTINALAMDIKGQIIDPFGGEKDLKAKVIKAVREPQERFQEDALRLLRAVRLAAQLHFTIEKETYLAIQAKAQNLKNISQERIRDELLKTLATPRSAWAIREMQSTGLLKFILPELLEGYKVGQNKHHIFDVLEHNLRSLEYGDKKSFPTLVKLAALLHDIGKPATKRGQGENATFYGHEVVGARMTERALKRLKFGNDEIKKVVALVRYHLFYYNAGEVTESSVRRLIRNVGMENVEDLLLVRQADRIGSGCPKAEPYKLRHLRYIIDKVSQDPISPKMLKFNGHDLMQLLGIAPGPKIGQILDVLLEKVIDNPLLNDHVQLEKMAQELAQLPEKELLVMRQKANEGIDKASQEEDKKTKKKYSV